MGYMSAVVNTKSDGDDKVDTWDDVNGETPKVDETTDVDQRQKDAAQH